MPRGKSYRRSEAARRRVAQLGRSALDYGEQPADDIRCGTGRRHKVRTWAMSSLTGRQHKLVIPAECPGKKFVLLVGASHLRAIADGIVKMPEGRLSFGVMSTPRIITLLQFDVHRLGFCSKKSISLAKAFCADRRQEEPFKMCDRKKLLLAAIVFYCNLTAWSTILLDMAPDAVDDMYDGCREEAMEKFIRLGLLRQELNSSKEFQNAWSANRDCPKLISGGTKEHTAALLAYADGEADFTNTFDNAVKTMGGNVSTYEHHFHFKALHFLLMDSMLLLDRKKCQTVYFLSEAKYKAQLGSKMRFGRFTKVYSSYLDMKKMDDLDGQVVFNITSCFFVNLGDSICSKDNGMLLLSPSEAFTVEAVDKITDERNDSEYTAIILKHSGKNNTHNCYSFSRAPAEVSTQWLVLMLVALSFFFSNY